MTTSLKKLILLVLIFGELSLKAQINKQTGNYSSDTILQIKTGFPFSDCETNNPISEKINVDGATFTNELSVFDFLQGKVSGLDILSASGDPGKNASAIIRGQNFTQLNSPLIVIDGIPQNSIDNSFNFYNSNNIYSNTIRNLIPVSLEDIKSIEILKDNISTSIFGTEGSDGVILIETKKGSIQKLRLTYETNQSFIAEPSYMPMLNGDEYIMYQLEAWHNAEGVFPIPEEIAYDRNHFNFYNYSANTNWIKAVTQPGYASNHYLSFSGGNKKNRYFGSINYNDQIGTIINTGYKRLLNRLNFEHYFTDKLSLSLNLNTTNNYYFDNVIPLNPNIWYSSTENSRYFGNKDFLEMAFIKAPNISIWEYDEDGNRTGDYFTPNSNYQGFDLQYYNPVAVSKSGNSTIEFKELMATTQLKYDFKEWLQFRESFSYNYLKADAPETHLMNRHYRNEIKAIVKIPFKDEKKHMLNGTLSRIAELENNFAYVTRFIGPLIKKKTNATVSSIYYKISNRYIVNANARFESFSIDNVENKGNNHYGVNLGWHFSEEPFLKIFQFLNNGMFNVGLSYSDYHPYAFFPTDPTTFFPLTRTVMSFNSGLKTSLFSNRIHFNLDYYNKETEDYYNENYFRLPIILRNKGWESMIDYTIIRMNNLNWVAQFNISHNSYIGVDPYKDIYNERISNSKYVWNKDQSPGSFYGLLYEGVYSSDQDALARDQDGNLLLNEGTPVTTSYYNYTFKGGDANYRDMNFDGKINEKDLVYLGNSIPKFTGGFGSILQFNNITLGINFHYRLGHKLIKDAEMATSGMLAKNNLNKNVLTRWRVQGLEGTDLLPRASFNTPANYLGSDLYVESGNFVRLSNINLEYKFNQAHCNKMHVKDFSFSLSAQRLFTFSKYSGLDPETELYDDYFKRSNIDEIRKIPLKIFTISFKVTI